MDPLEQKQTHSYPNADREVGSVDGDNKYTPRPLVHFSDIVSQVKKEDDSKKTSSVHTFKDDLTKETTKDSFSLGKIVMSNNKRAREEQNNNASLGNKTGSHFGVKILLAIICVLIVGAFSYIGFTTSRNPETAVVGVNNGSQQVVGGILYSEQIASVDVNGKSRADLYGIISQGISAAKIPSGKIESVVFNSTDGTTTTAISAADFLGMIAPSAPYVLTRNLKDEYVFGYYSYQ